MHVDPARAARECCYHSELCVLTVAEGGEVDPLALGKQILYETI